MRESGREFADVLAEAQKLGYAEADPSFDIDGIDAAHKLAILASVAFGRPVDLAGVYAEGIRHVSRLDIDFAEELGYRIKLLGIARLTEDGLEQRVHPCMVPRATPIAAVEGVFNAVVAEGDFVGRVVLRRARRRRVSDRLGGRRRPRRHRRRAPRRSRSACRPPICATLPGAPMERHQGAYYIRLMVVDQPGRHRRCRGRAARRAGVDGIDDPARPRAGRGGAGRADDPCHRRGGDAPGARRRSARSTPCSSRRA